MKHFRRIVNKNFKEILILVCISLIALIIFKEFGINECAWNYFSDALKLFFLAVTAIIALRIFDRFGINKKLSEKRTELIIELLIELKKIYFRADIDKRIWTPFYATKNIKSQLDWITKEERDIKILIYPPDLDNAMEKIILLKNNPLMPLILVEKMKFLEPTGGQNSPEITETHRTKLFFSKLAIEMRKEEKYWMATNNNDCSLSEFIDKFHDLFNEIEIWIEKHSNLHDKLNI